MLIKLNYEKRSRYRVLQAANIYWEDYLRRIRDMHDLVLELVSFIGRWFINSRIGAARPPRDPTKLITRLSEKLPRNILSPIIN